MDLFIFNMDTKIAPFNDDVSATLILDEELAEQRRRIAAALELELVEGDEIPAGPVAVVFDYVFLSIALLKDFLEQAKTSGAEAMLGLKRDFL
ncbi:MAG: hypothetical protein ABH877_01655, partial [bacterium]